MNMAKLSFFPLHPTPGSLSQQLSPSAQSETKPPFTFDFFLVSQTVLLLRQELKSNFLFVNVEMPQLLLPCGIVTNCHLTS